MKGRRDPVAKNMNEFNKPKTFRDRKKEVKLGEVKREHPKHEPYARVPVRLGSLRLEEDDLYAYREEDGGEDNFPMETYNKGKAYDD